MRVSWGQHWSRAGYCRSAFEKAAQNDCSLLSPGWMLSMRSAFPWQGSAPQRCQTRAYIVLRQRITFSYSAWLLSLLQAMLDWFLGHGLQTDIGSHSTLCGCVSAFLLQLGRHSPGRVPMPFSKWCKTPAFCYCLNWQSYFSCCSGFGKRCVSRSVWLPVNKRPTQTSKECQ